MIIYPPKRTNSKTKKEYDRHLEELLSYHKACHSQMASFDIKIRQAGRLLSTIIDKNK
jgi:hypothetical protein